MTTADLTSTPWRLALAIADSSGGMVASTTAHGDATIMNVIARSSALCRSSPASSGTAKIASVATTTPDRVPLLDLLDEQLGPRLGRAGLLDHGRRSGPTTLSRDGSGRPRRSARRCRCWCRRRPRRRTVLSTGSGSPVIDAWSTSEAAGDHAAVGGDPLPGPHEHPVADRRSAAATCRSAPSPASRVACSGARSVSPRTASAVRRVANASSAPEVAKMTISSAPSKTWPIAAAPIAATIISRSTSRVFSRSAWIPAQAGSQPPTA